MYLYAFLLVLPLNIVLKYESYPIIIFHNDHTLTKQASAHQSYQAPSIPQSNHTTHHASFSKNHCKILAPDLSTRSSKFYKLDACSHLDCLLNLISLAISDLKYDFSIKFSLAHNYYLLFTINQFQLQFLN